MLYAYHVMNNEMKHLLIVDDDPDCLYQLKLILSKCGYRVTALESQASAEQWLESNCPDLAVFDLMMDREDSGFILSRMLKKKTPDIPVVILTSVTPETGVSFDLKSNGNQQWIMADLYLEKGIDKETLCTQVEQLLK